MSKKANKEYNALSIDYDFEPWTRKWCGGLGYHPYNNAVGGANSKTRLEFQLQMEQRNRKNKLLKQKNKSK